MTLIRHATAENTPKPCECFKSEYRDPACQITYPAICPWWELQLTRHITGKFPPLPRPAPTEYADEPGHDGPTIEWIVDDPMQCPPDYERKGPASE